MLEVGAIRKSHIPWDNEVTLGRKEDGSLRFCIDMRRLNVRIVREAYTLSRIDENLDC